LIEAARPKSVRKTREGDDFKPLLAELRPTGRAACDYTKRPEVKAREPVAALARRPTPSVATVTSTLARVV
jgi:hypothetical protein